MRFDKILMFSTKNKYAFVMSLTILPIVSMMVFVFLTSYRPVFYSLQEVINAGINQINPVHELQVALIHAVMPPNDALIHGGAKENQNWIDSKREVDHAFQNVLNMKSLETDYDLLLRLKKQWEDAKKQGDQLLQNKHADNACSDHEKIMLMETFDENIRIIAVELHQLIDHKERVILELYSGIKGLKIRGLSITLTSIAVGILLGIAGIIWLTKDRKKLKDLSLYDPLTGIFNRKALDFHLSRLDKHQKESKIPCFSILLIDIDKFKSVNDNFGHDTGDIVLKSFAGTIQNVVRSADVFGRFGGEEFLVLLPGSSTKDAIKMAERIRSKISLSTVNEPGGGASIRITASIGVSTYPHDASTIDALLKSADTAMYEAKNSGRNQVVSAGKL